MPSRDPGATGADSEDQFENQSCPRPPLPVRLLENPRLWWLLCLIPAAIHAWANAHEMNPDGLVYIDMATESLRHGPSNLINPLWSPGFPALLAAGISLFQPSPAAEFPFAHLVTFLSFCLALSGFAFFLKSYTSSLGPASSPAQTREQTPMAYAVFLWIAIEFIGLRKVAPDLLMAAISFSAAGICCRLYSQPASNRLLALLGVILGLGYYAKAPIFPMGILLLALIFIWPPPSLNRRRLFLPAAVFLLVSTPLIVLMSAKVGRFSLGEAGRVNYLWHVNGLKPVGWTGDANPAFGAPLHPPRKLQHSPVVLEFASPVKGTYPLWYDPAYWYAGAKPILSLRHQISALILAAQVYWWSAQMQVILIGVALALLSLAGLPAVFRWPHRLDAVLLCWAVAAMAMFAVVHTEYRYIAPFIIPAWITLYAHLGAGLTPQVRRAVHLCLALVVLIHLASALPKLAATALSVSRGTSTPSYIQTANALRSAGVRPGDPLATIGPAFDAYFARFLGSRVIAQVDLNQPDPPLSPAAWQRVRQTLARHGVRALIAPSIPPGAAPGDWKTLPPGAYSVMLIPPADAPSR